MSIGEELSNEIFAFSRIELNDRVVFFNFFVYLFKNIVGFFVLIEELSPLVCSFEAIRVRGLGGLGN